jgi:sugar/nucleoside kinase (ribokinase family)
MHDLLVVGEINADLLVTGSDVRPRFGQVEKLVSRAALAVGGSSVITACAAARLGLRTAFVGIVGDDVAGRFLLDALRARGVDVSGIAVDPRHETGISVVLIDESGDGDRAILTAPGAMTALRAGDVDRDLVVSARHVHCGGYFLQPGLRAGLPELFESARRSGATTSLDPNWDPSQTWDGGIHDVLAAADVFLPNEAELLAIARVDSVEDAVDALGRDDLTIAVKRGADGGEWHRGSTHVALPAAEVDVVDATGAGDAFDAGLLQALTSGRPPEHQLALAVACGSLATRALGGIESQPQLAEALLLASTLVSNGSPA